MFYAQEPKKRKKPKILQRVGIQSVTKNNEKGAFSSVTLFNNSFTDLLGYMIEKPCDIIHTKPFTMLKQFKFHSTLLSPVFALLLAGFFALPLVPPALAQTGDPATNLADAINNYRNTGSQWNRNIGSWNDQEALVGAPQSLQGKVILTLDQTLMDAAEETAKKFANGTYSYNIQNPHHQMDAGKLNGPTVRAIKDGWEPSINTLYSAGTTPPHTGIRENLFQGPPHLDFNQVLEGWKNSPGHNFALLKAQAHRIGVGMAQNNTNSYWVFLVESEAHMDESNEAMPLFGWNVFFEFKPGITPNPNNPAVDVWQIKPGAVQNIRQRR